MMSCFEYKTDYFFTSDMFWENKRCYDFYWITPCITMSIYRTYTSADLQMWIIVSTMILLNYVLFLLSVSPLPIIRTMWLQGTDIIVIVILTLSLNSISNITFFHWSIPYFLFDNIHNPLICNYYCYYSSSDI